MAQYFGQYSGGYQWVPSNYYQMLTQPTQNITQGAQSMVGNLAQGYIGMKQGQAAQAKEDQQLAGMRMATKPSLELAQRYSQQYGVPMPESLANASSRFAQMSAPELQGFNQGLSSYMQFAQQQAAAAKAAEAQRFAATQAAMMNAIGMTQSMPVSQPQVYQQPAQSAPVSVQRYASPEAYRYTIGTSAGF